MQLSINENREITSFVLVGGVVGGIEVSDNDNYFMHDFDSCKYLLTRDNEIIENKNYDAEVF